jgi:hypothetical protein
VGGRAVHGGGPRAPGRPAPARARAPGRDHPARRGQLRRRHQPLHRRGPARPHQAAGRVRRDRPTARPRAVQAGRHHRHRLARGRDLRQGRRARARVVGGRRRARAALRPAARGARLRRLPGGRGPRRAGHGAARALPVPGPLRARAARERGPARRGLAGAAAGGDAEPGRRPSVALVPARRLERAAGRGPRVRDRAPADGRGTAGRLLQPADPDGAGRARARRGRAAGHRRARRLVRGREPVRAARARARLRVERHVGGPGQHRHVRARPLRAGRLAAEPALDALPLPRALPAGRGAGEDQPLDADAGRPDAGRRAAAAGRAHAARARRGPRHGARAAGGVRPAALDLLPRGRLGRRVHGLQRPGGGARRRLVPARGAQDRLHVQLVLRRREADRLFQLGREPGARAADRPRLPRARHAAQRVARVERVRAPSARDRPALPGQLEQQAGARLPRLGHRRVLLHLPAR